jgi:hypothetical protein
MRFLLVLIAAGLFAADPKLGDSREEVIRLMGEPSSINSLPRGGAIFSFTRGDVYFDDKVVIRLDLMTEAEAARRTSRNLEAKTKQAAASGAHSSFVEKIKSERFLNADVLSSRMDLVSWKTSFFSKYKKKTIASAEWVVGPNGSLSISIQFLQSDDMRTVRQEACIELIDESDRILGVIGESNSYPSRPGRDDRLSFMYWNADAGRANPPLVIDLKEVRNSTMPKVVRNPDGSYTQAFMDYVTSIKYLRLESTDSTIAYPLVRLVSR